jgi:hypothetical protein
MYASLRMSRCECVPPLQSFSLDENSLVTTHTTHACRLLPSPQIESLCAIPTTSLLTNKRSVNDNSTFRHNVPALIISHQNLKPSSSHINVVADVRLEVVHLADLHALLAQDIVRGGHVEEEVRNEPAVDVAGAGHLESLAGAHANGDGGVLTLVDCGLVGAVDDGGDFVDAGVEVGEGLEVVLEGLGFGAAEAGDGLL